MNSDIDGINIGLKLKALRLERKLSLNKLAGKAAMAVSFLSRIESGNASPTIASLQKILRALGVDILEFFQTDKKEWDISDKIVFPSGEMKVLRDNDRIWAYVLPSHPEIKSIMTYEEYAPHTKNLERESHPGDLCGYVLEGELVLEIIGRAVRKAKAGDAFYVKSGVEHIARNESSKTLKMIVIVLKQ